MGRESQAKGSQHQELHPLSLLLSRSRSSQSESFSTQNCYFVNDLHKICITSFLAVPLLILSICLVFIASLVWTDSQIDLSVALSQARVTEELWD